MQTPTRIRLAPHHLDILEKGKADNYRRWEEHMHFMYVKWYPIVFPGAYCLSEGSVRRMAEFFRALSRSPNLEIDVVGENEVDSICNLCDNLTDGKCLYGSNGRL